MKGKFRFIGQPTLNYIFLNTLDELRYRNRINHYSEYDLLRSSALIRQLFLDGGKSLTDLVNKSYGVKLKFRVIAAVNDEREGNFLYQNIYPINDKYIELKQQDFLKITIIKVNNYEYSILETIKHACHVLGGVHLGKATDKKEELFKDMGGIINLENISKFLAIQCICRIIIDTLTELEIEIKKQSNGFK